MQTIKHPSEMTGFSRLTRKSVHETLQGFGFTEIADILNFLDFMCGSELDVSEITYLRQKIHVCLRRNDNGDNYFIALREFATDLDCLRV
ncbi:hypothetical protein, partial [Pantoea agglomerans]|uniref:hypothetical protein n=2 Tax=Enterobacter agglomerans TaxID=549 RepID=UPI001A7E730C